MPLAGPRPAPPKPPRLLEIPLPKPGPGQVVVRVLASAINPADLRVSSGEFVGRLLHARTRPLVTGYDLAGVVETAGERFKAGDKVFGFLPYSGSNDRGAFAEQVVAAEAELSLLPQGLSPEVAAAIATPGVTALQCLRDLGGLSAGGHALVIGAAGGVGSLAVGIARRLGGRVTAVCSGYAMDFVRSLGAEDVVDRKSRDPLALPGPFDVVFDAAAAHSYFAFRRHLSPKGAYVTTLPGPAALLGAALAPIHGQKCAFIAVKSVPSDLGLLASWALDGWTVHIDRVYPLGELGAALERLRAGKVQGRIVIQVKDGF